MFGQAKPVVFDPHRGRRGQVRVPKWLVLLLLGLAGGAGGVLYVQQELLPPRLSIEQSQQLQTDFQRAEGERQRLAGELGTLKRQFEVATAESRRRDQELMATRSLADRQKADIGVLVDALPPDPRGGEVQVRAARFDARGGQLAYDVVLTRKAGSRPVDMQLQFTVAGAAAGRETSVALKPVAFTIGAHEVLRGSVKLPEDFQPRQTTVQVLDRANRALGMRVLRVD